MLVETTMENVALYCKSELPPDHVYDAKMMNIQGDFKGYDTPKELLDALPRISRLDKSAFLSPENLWSNKGKIDGRWQYPLQ